jgi:hypothetical protein
MPMSRLPLGPAPRVISAASSAAEDGVSGGVASSLLNATSVAADFNDRFPRRSPFPGSHAAGDTSAPLEGFYG